MKRMRLLSLLLALVLVCTAMPVTADWQMLPSVRPIQSIPRGRAQKTVPAWLRTWLRTVPLGRQWGTIPRRSRPGTVSSRI